MRHHLTPRRRVKRPSGSLSGMLMDRILDIWEMFSCENLNGDNGGNEVAISITLNRGILNLTLRIATL